MPQTGISYQKSTVCAIFIMVSLLCFHQRPFAQEPQLFLEELLTNKVEYGATVSNDGKTVYFVKTDSFYTPTPKTIYKLVKQGDTWSDAEVASFSGEYSDSSPFLSPDGTRLFFASRRPHNGITPKYNHVWYVDIENGIEGTPRYLEVVNSSYGAFSPSVDASGNLYFGSVRDNGHGSGDIWRSAYVDGEYQAPTNLGGNVNSKNGEWGSCISPCGQYIIFENSGNPENLSPAGDLYIAVMKDGAWQTPIRFDNAINSIGSDLTPRIHKNMFYFASNRPRESGLVLNNVDLYQCRLADVLQSVGLADYLHED